MQKIRTILSAGSHSPALARKNPEAACHVAFLEWISKACISDSPEFLSKLVAYWDYSESFIVEVHPTCIDVYLCYSFSEVNKQILAAFSENLTLFFMFHEDSTTGMSKFCFPKKYLGGDVVGLIRTPVHTCAKEKSCKRQ